MLPPFPLAPQVLCASRCSRVLRWCLCWRWARQTACTTWWSGLGCSAGAQRSWGEPKTWVAGRPHRMGSRPPLGRESPTPPPPPPPLPPHTHTHTWPHGSRTEPNPGLGTDREGGKAEQAAVGQHRAAESPSLPPRCLQLPHPLHHCGPLVPAAASKHPPQVSSALTRMARRRSMQGWHVIESDRILPCHSWPLQFVDAASMCPVPP